MGLNSRCKNIEDFQSRSRLWGSVDIQLLRGDINTISNIILAGGRPRVISYHLGDGEI